MALSPFPDWTSWSRTYLCWLLCLAPPFSTLQQQSLQNQAGSCLRLATDTKVLLTGIICIFYILTFDRLLAMCLWFLIHSLDLTNSTTLLIVYKLRVLFLAPNRLGFKTSNLMTKGFCVKIAELYVAYFQTTGHNLILLNRPPNIISTKMGLSQCCLNDGVSMESHNTYQLL